jgi:hypothetical protein
MVREGRDSAVPALSCSAPGNHNVNEDSESYLEELNGPGVEGYDATYQQALERANDANAQGPGSRRS